MLRVLFIGDIVAKTGRRAIKEFLPRLRAHYDPHIIIANVENSAGGLGITPKIAEELKSYGIDYMTSGNHIWKHKEVFSYMENNDFLIRPLNYPDFLFSTPGHGFVEVKQASLWNKKIYIVNLIGRVFMDNVDCPFQSIDNFIKDKEDSIILVDFHAEASSEKIAMGWFLSGRVSAVVGTHTHVQTADERILDGHTAYITDLGMTGASDTVIGVNKNRIIEKLISSRPVRFEFSESDNMSLNGVLVSIDDTTGHATSIERIVVGTGDFAGISSI